MAAFLFIVFASVVGVVVTSTDTTRSTTTTAGVSSCKMVKPCLFQLDSDHVIDMRSLKNPLITPDHIFRLYYAYHPCIPFSCGSQKSLACLERDFLPKREVLIPAGVTANCSNNGGNIQLQYDASPVRFNVELICRTGETSLKHLSTTGTNYTMNLYSPHACKQSIKTTITPKTTNTTKTTHTTKTTKTTNTTKTTPKTTHTTKTTKTTNTTKTTPKTTHTTNTTKTTKSTPKTTHTTKTTPKTTHSTKTTPKTTHTTKTTPKTTHTSKSTPKGQTTKPSTRTTTTGAAAVTSFLSLSSMATIALIIGRAIKN